MSEKECSVLKILPLFFRRNRYVLVWVLVAVWSRCVDCQNNFFVAKQYGNDKHVCVTNSSFALSWTDENIENVFEEVSTYIPKSKNNNFDCDLKDDKKTSEYYLKKPWVLRNSINSDINEVILDRRWEDFKVMKTEFTDIRNEMLKYEKVPLTLEHDFVVPFSLRTEKEAHIFLCDGSHPSESNCYWFMLQAWGGESSAIRKCGKEDIPNLHLKYPKAPCSTKLTAVEHNSSENYGSSNYQSLPNYLSNTAWSHFKLTKRDTYLSLVQIYSGKEEKTILQWVDDQQQGKVIDVTQMFIHSKMVKALWKIHQVDYIYTNEEGNKITLGPPVEAIESTICVSMFVSMCQSCTLDLILTQEDRIIKQKSFWVLHAGWSQFKFIVENVQGNNFQLSVSTNGTSTDRVWAIDTVRQCQKKEFRIISLNENALCQLMSDEHTTIKFDDYNPMESDEKNCPEDTIGQFCVPYQWIFQEPQRISICSKDEMTETAKCFCSAGYQNSQCYYECQKGKYGHGCQKKCEEGHHCVDYCNVIDGKCKSCHGNYTGSNCDILKAKATYFTVGPNVTDIKYTQATILLDKFDVENLVAGDEPSTYAIQYKEADGYDQIWTILSSQNKFNEAKTFELVGLKADTKYVVRGIITTLQGNKYVDDHIPTTAFTTICRELTENNIIVEPSNTTASVILTETTAETCKIEGYSISIYNVGGPKSSNESTIFFDNLTPYTDYTVTFLRESNRTPRNFRTREGVPEKIQSVDITSTLPTSITFQWERPTKIYGALKHYIVEYQHMYYVACHPEPSRLASKNKISNTNYTTLEGLIPFSNYSISVVAVNNANLRGPPNIVNTSTSASEKIQNEETPQNFEIVPSSKNATIKLSEVDCTRVQGVIFMKMTPRCTNEWCEPHETQVYQMLHNQIVLKDLIPFSDYSVTSQFCRGGNDCSKTITKQFKTDPAVPHGVRDLVVYSKDEDSISLRWKPPYPPTGYLQFYTVDQSYYTNYFDQQKKKALNYNKTACELWPGFDCVKITNLFKNKDYRLTVYARNEKPEGLGLPKNITATTKTEPSEPPYNLSIIWTRHNDLELQWKHPNRSNGKIENFQIKLKPLQNKATKSEKLQTLEVTEDTYNLTYYYTVQAKDIIPSTEYEISVYAYNGMNGKAKPEIEYSPPDIPNFEKNVTFTSSNETITAKFKIKNPRGTERGNCTVLLLLLDKENPNTASYPQLKEFDLNYFRVVDILSVNNFTNEITFTIGNGTKQNPLLRSETSYNISIVLINIFKNKTRSNVLHEKFQTMGKAPPTTPNSSLLGLLALLLIIPVIIFIYMKRSSIKKSFVQNSNSTAQILELQENHSILPTNITKPTPQPRTAKTQPKKTDNEKIHSKAIRVTEFEEYVKESVHNKELERQHALFPRGQTKPWDYGVIKENKAKNRYNNLIAYDHSRVVLEKIDGEPYSDYINANYIDGHRIPKAYIATQGPKPSTLFDFWRMIWQENVKHIVMLANVYEDGKKKVEKYWPAINETLNFGDISVQYTSNKVHADFEHRIFNVTRNEETRQVEQLHFLSWPDHGVPLYSQSIVPFLQEMLKLPLSSKSPIVIHCSAGVGRTGTILLCDICLRMAAREGIIDVLRKLQKLRNQRPNLVDNIEQYKLAHLVILECLSGMHTTIPCDQIQQAVQKLLRNDGIKLQMQYLNDTQWQDQAMKTAGQNGKSELVVKEKNRFPDIIPEIQGRLFITRNPPEDETSSYINAVKIDGFRAPGRFIVTQQPLPNTVGDFWRLVEENYISVIISLNEINRKDKTSCHFWPTEKSPQMNPGGGVTLQHANTIPLECYDIITIHMSRHNRKNHGVIEIFSFKNWPPMVNCPSNIKQFLSFWEDSEAASRKSQTVVVTCYDGVKASGIYVAMSFVIEKMKLEQSCDVCQAVRTIRHNRMQFVQEEEQFAFLYRAAVEYIDGFQSYANFS